MAPGGTNGPGESGELSPDEWGRLLSGELGCPVRVTYGRSRTTPIQGRRWTRKRGAPAPGLELRLHSVFRSAPEDVRRALVSWLRSGRRARAASERLDRWIPAELDALPKPEARLRPRGEVYDLSAVRDELCERWLPHLDRPAITWGRRGRTAARWSLRLGTYYPEDDLIRVHRVLDQPAVPRWFVAFVVYHELLHADIPPVRSGGRLVYHTPEFRRRERAFPDYERAVAWEDQHLPRLIRSARTGDPLKVRRERRAPAEEPRGGWRQGLLFPQEPGAPSTQ